MARLNLEDLEISNKPFGKQNFNTNYKYQGHCNENKQENNFANMATKMRY